jgi:hypothetical protein
MLSCELSGHAQELKFVPGWSFGKTVEWTGQARQFWSPAKSLYALESHATHTVPLKKNPGSQAHPPPFNTFEFGGQEQSENNFPGNLDGKTVALVGQDTQLLLLVTESL